MPAFKPTVSQYSDISFPEPPHSTITSDNWYQKEATQSAPGYWLKKEAKQPVSMTPQPTPSLSQIQSKLQGYQPSHDISIHLSLSEIQNRMVNQGAPRTQLENPTSQCAPPPSLTQNSTMIPSAPITSDFRQASDGLPSIADFLPEQTDTASQWYTKPPAGTMGAPLSSTEMPFSEWIAKQFPPVPAAEPRSSIPSPRNSRGFSVPPAVIQTNQPTTGGPDHSTPPRIASLRAPHARSSSVPPPSGQIGLPSTAISGPVASMTSYPASHPSKHQGLWSLNPGLR